MSDYPPEPKQEEILQFKRNDWMLAMLAAQLPRKEDGSLDFKAAYQAWFEAQQLRPGEYEEVDNFHHKMMEHFGQEIIPFPEALDKAGTSRSNWKDTLSRKLRNLGHSKEEIHRLIEQRDRDQGIPYVEMMMRHHTSSAAGGESPISPSF